MQQLTGLSGLFGGQLQYRTADVRTDYPNGWTTVGSQATTEGPHVSSTGALSGDYMWVQGGLAASVSSGTSVAEAYCKLQTSVQTDAVIVSSRTIRVNPSPNGRTSYVSVGRPFPALGLTGLMFACVVSQVGGTIAYRPAWRGIAGDPLTTDGFTQIGTSRTGITASEDHNFGVVSVSPTGTQNLAQAAISFSGDTAQAKIAIIVAAVYG